MTGGRAALAGFLYQLLRTLQATTALTSRITVHSIRDTALSAVLEPEPAQGGDLVVDHRTVFQYKRRLGTKPWKQGEIIGSVLPDLYRAIPAPGRRNAVRYVFSTDVAVDLPQFRTFLTLFRDTDVPADPLAALDDHARDFRIGTKRVTARALFRAIVDRLDTSSDGPAKVWRLLASFEIEDGVSEGSAECAIDTALDEVVNHREEVPNKRRELIGSVLRFATQGRRFTPEELFRTAAIDARRFGHVERVPALLARDLVDDLRAIGYVPKHDVRRIGVSWPDDAGLLALAGESGNGKSWVLASLARRLAESGRAVILLADRGGLERIEREVVRRVWLSGGFDHSLDIESVADRVRRRLGRADDPWLTLCIDDVQDRDRLRSLAEPRWRRMGIRIAVSVHDRIAAGLRGVEGMRVEPVEVFSLPELRDYLAAGGLDWTRLPNDVLGWLRRPVLARFYRELDGGTGWLPVNEYALMERYWRYATSERGNQADHLDDAEALKRVAGTLLDDPPPAYPWPIRVLERQKLGDPMRRRLIDAGLLRSEGDGVAASHDRLLNWMVAERLAERFQDRELGPEELAAVLGRITNRRAAWAGDFAARRLGYVPLDVFWLVAERVEPERLAAVILALSRDQKSDLAGDVLFKKELLGSLGVRIVPVLVALLRQMTEKKDRRLPTSVGQCLAAIGRNAPDAVVRAAKELLGLEASPATEAALIALAATPAPELLDRLWTIHLKHLRASDEGGDEAFMEHHLETERSFNALAAAVIEDPDWIGRTILRPGPCERADQLVYLLMRLDPEPGAELWLRTKDAFFNKVTRNRRCLAQAIGIFRDRAEIVRLESWKPVDDERLDHAQVLHALVRIDPNRALQWLRSMPEDELMGTTNWWLPGLMHRTGEAACRELHAIHEDGPWERRRNLAILFNGRDIHASATVVRSIAAALEERLAAVDNDPDWEPRGEGHMLRFLASLRRPDLLAVLEEQRGTRFESLLVRRACRRRGRTSLCVDGVGNYLKRILLAIGGEGIGQLVEAELSRSSSFARIDGLKSAVWSPTEGVRARLRAMAEEMPTDDQEAYQLGYALAALNEDEALARFIRNGGGLLQSVLDLRTGRLSFASHVVSDAVAALTSDDPDRHRQALLLLAVANDTGTGVRSALVAVLDRFPPDSEEVNLAVFALDTLGLFAPDLLPRLAMMLSGKHCLTAMNCLLHHGGEQGRAVLVQELERNTLHNPNLSDEQLARILLRHDDSRQGALAFLRRVLERGLGFWSEGRLLRSLAEAGDSSVRPRLYECAVRADQHRLGWLDALRFVAAEDPVEGFALALRHMAGTGNLALPGILMTIDAQRGLDELLRRLPDETSVALRGEIARALRWHADPALMTPRLGDMAASCNPRVREAAAEVIGWQEPRFMAERLSQLAEGVEAAALLALRRHREQETARDLLAAIPDAGTTRRWCLLRALVHVADPRLLQHTGDPLCLWPVIDHLPPEYGHWAEQELKERLEKLERDERQGT